VCPSPPVCPSWPLPAATPLHPRHPPLITLLYQGLGCSKAAAAAAVAGGGATRVRSRRTSKAEHDAGQRRRSAESSSSTPSTAATPRTPSGGKRVLWADRPAAEGRAGPAAPGGAAAVSGTGVTAVGNMTTAASLSKLYSGGMTDQDSPCKSQPLRGLSSHQFYVPAGVLSRDPRPAVLGVADGTSKTRCSNEAGKASHIKVAGHDRRSQGTAGSLDWLLTARGAPAPGADRQMSTLPAAAGSLSCLSNNTTKLLQPGLAGGPAAMAAPVARGTASGGMRGLARAASRSFTNLLHLSGAAGHVDEEDCSVNTAGTITKLQAALLYRRYWAVHGAQHSSSSMSWEWCAHPDQDPPCDSSRLCPVGSSACSRCCCCGAQPLTRSHMMVVAGA